MRKERYPVMVGLKMPTDLYNELRRLAEEDDRSISAYIRRLVADAVAQRKNPNASASDPEAV